MYIDEALGKQCCYCLAMIHPNAMLKGMLVSFNSIFSDCLSGLNDGVGIAY